MKQVMIILLLSLITTMPLIAQSKWAYSIFNDVTELKGTEYMIVSATNNSKTSVKGRSLLFINTATGESNEINFPEGTYIKKVEHVKIDSLGINKVIVIGELNTPQSRKKLTFNPPIQVMVCSVDGKTRQQITENSFLVAGYAVNDKTGVVVITGYLDTNNNMKQDKKDKPQTMLYSLGEMKQLSIINH